jgi:Na+/melibiose symporter-like transporter
MVLASLAFSFVPFLGAGDGVYFFIITLLSGLSLGADMALPAAIQADIAQRFEKDEKALTGVLFGFWAMLTKFSLALAVGISFSILGLSGFDPKLPALESLSALSLLYGLAPVLFKGFAIACIYRYNDEI